MTDWINVNKRLPYLYQPVLCFSESIDGKSYYYSVDYMIDDSQWCSASLSWKYEVTHWMELPEPPISKSQTKVLTEAEKRQIAIRCGREWRLSYHHLLSVGRIEP